KNRRKKIRDIKIGEEVLTHKNRFKKVTKTFTRMHKGNFIRIYFGRNLKNRNFKYDDATAITCTEDHPILVLRNNIKQWVPAKEILLSDKLFVLSKQCKYCEKYVPHWRKTCTKCIDNNKKLLKEKSELKYIHKETKIVIVPIIKITEPKHRNRKVYNFEVEEDNSYIAAGVVVHNCGTFQSQTPFMREKSIQAHKGSWLVEINLCSSGTVESVKTELIAFYD
ncbi:MAG: Hint domain-containing protein, partial [Candidatus Altarchaeum sp.]|nr:Hint domain-containing protein [Candidatus Altarchaeum sp.]